MITPFDLPGPQFLALYGFGLALAIASGLFLPAWLRPTGREGWVRDVDDLAFLAGGTRRFSDALMARLLAGRSVGFGERGRLVVQAPGGGRTAAEREILRLAGPIRPSAVEQALAAHADPIETRLVGSGLLLDRAATRRMRRWQTSPYLVLLAFGGIKLVVGVARDRPVGFLTGLMLLTAVLAWVRWRNVDRRTGAGERLLRGEQARADRMRRAPLPAETDQAVALFGTAVLAGSAYESYHKIRQQGGGDGSSSPDGGSSDGGGDGGGSGGCGGGGCGGCGS